MFSSAIVLLGALDATLILAPKFAPVPRREIEAAAQSPNYPESQGKEAKTKPAPLAAPVEPGKEAVASGDDGNAVASNDEKQTVKIGSLPPITIADKQKTFWDHALDWGPWAFNALLAIAAILQVWLLFRTWEQIKDQARTMRGQAEKDIEKTASDTVTTAATLAAMKRQADSMEKQATHMESQIAEMKQQGITAGHIAAAALSQIELVKNKERARLSLEILNFTFGSPATVGFRITCHGTTPAIVRSSSEVTSILLMPDIGWPKGQFGSPIPMMPEVISPGSSEHFTFIMFPNLANKPGSFHQAIESGIMHLHFRVRICYEDIFGNPYPLEVSKVYGVPPAESGGLFAEWHDSKYKYGEDAQKAN